MSNQDSIVIERHFNADIDLIWKMWTMAEHFSQWYGPRGMTIPVAEMDVTVGGKRKICMEMKTPERHMKMWFTGEYTDVSPTSRLAYTEAMCDEDGNLIPPSAMGMPEGTPSTTEVIVELESVDGGTKMKMSHVGVPADSPGAGGWKMAIEKMAEYIETMQGQS